MSQAPLNIADGTGAAVLSEINAALANLSTLCSGSTDPSTLSGGVLALSLWLDTTTTPYILKQRNAANTGWTTLYTIDQTAGTLGIPELRSKMILETETISATAATGTIQFDNLTQAILSYTTNASGNFTLNVRGNSTVALNSLMAIGESTSIAFKCKNGTTAYYLTELTIDGSSVTPQWQGGATPTTGNASATDIYAFVITKTANATFTAVASQTKFA
jgi:hypothetical protein